MAAKEKVGMSGKEKKIFVGKLPGGDCVVFRSTNTPTETTHRRFRYVIGPFRTVRGANFMASPAARNNPHVQTVADAERIAKKLSIR
jgi:hypothetical protein